MMLQVTAVKLETVQETIKLILPMYLTVYCITLKPQK